MHSDVISRTVTFLKSWLSLRYEQCDIPGFAVAIAVDGKVVLDEAYGFANLAKKEKLTTNHLFRVASHSKTFAGTALMQLSEKGKINIDMPVVQYLSWLAKHKDKRMNKITTRQLLSHSAGINRDGQDSDFWVLARPFPDVEELQRELLAADLVFDCNTKMKYSNNGYGLLGMLVEAVSGMPFNSYAEEHIIAPLALKNTGPEVKDSIKSRLASAYTRVEWTCNKERLLLDSTIDTRALSAATGFYSSAADLCRYFSAHIPGSGELLDDETKKEMQRTQWPVTNSTFDQEYALGLQIDKVGRRRVIGHAGGFPGHATRTLCDPRAKIVVSTLSNCIDADPTAICRAVFSFFDHFEKNARAAKQLDASQIERIDRFQGRFINLFKVMDVLPNGDELIGFNPGSWTPLSEVEDLEIVDDNTLRMKRGNGFAFEGECLPYSFDSGGRAGTIKCGGYTMYAEKEYGADLSRFGEAAKLITSPKS